MVVHTTWFENNILIFFRLREFKRFVGSLWCKLPNWTCLLHHNTSMDDCPGTPEKKGTKHCQDVAKTGLSPLKKKNVSNRNDPATSERLDVDDLSTKFDIMSPSKNHPDFDLGMTSPLNQRLGVQADDDLNIDYLGPGFTPVKLEDGLEGTADLEVDEMAGSGDNWAIGDLFGDISRQLLHDDPSNVDPKTIVHNHVLPQYVNGMYGSVPVPPVAVAPAQNVTEVDVPPLLCVPIPNKLQSTYKTFQVMSEFCPVVPNGKKLGSSNPDEMTTEESIAVKKILQQTCPVYARRGDSRKVAGRVSQAIANGFEFVATFYCKGFDKKKQSCGCNVERKLIRVNGGLVMMAKCEKDDNGNMVPISHNMEHHRIRRKGRGYEGKAGPLSISQMTHILRNCPSHHGERDTFVAAMMNDGDMPCSPAQRSNVEEFKRSIFQYYERNYDKYYAGVAKKNKVMKLDILLEIVQLLKVAPYD